MSDILQKAIIDAKMLRETAIKNVQDSILEKYSKQIKEAVNELLEKENEEDIPVEDVLDVPEENTGEEMGNVIGGGMEKSFADEQVPLAATNGEKMCQCPDNDEEIELDFSQLEKQMSEEEQPDINSLNVSDGIGSDISSDKYIPEDEEDKIPIKEGEFCSGKKEEEKENVTPIPIPESEEIPVEEKKSPTQELPSINSNRELGQGRIATKFKENPEEKEITIITPKGLYGISKVASQEGEPFIVFPVTIKPDYSQGKKMNADEFEKSLGNEWGFFEDIFSLEEQESSINEDEMLETIDNLDEDTIQKIVEEIQMEYEPEGNGWIGTGKADRKQEELGALAALQNDEETKEKYEELKKSYNALQENHNILLEQKNNLSNENKDLKNNTKSLIVKLNDINIQNAKLYYTNRILKDIGLNDKQKELFVEQISKTDTVDKSKIIYETLLNSMGNRKESKKSFNSAIQSLNEAVNKPSTTSIFLNSQQEEKIISDPLKEKMQKMAGINKRK